MIPNAANGSANHLLLPTIFEVRAKANPDGVWAKFPVSDDSYEAGFRCATNQQVLNAINRVAWLLEAQLGKGERFETLAYIGPNDLRYFVVVMAAIKVGYKVLLPNPQNSRGAHLSLLAKLRCRVLITTSPDKTLHRVILDHYPMHRVQIPTVEELLDGSETVHYPYDKKFDEAKDDPILVLHTPASTVGNPKAMIYTHDSILRSVAAIPPPERDHLNKSLETSPQSGRLLLMLPSFHIAGLAMSLIISSFETCVTVYPVPHTPPTTTNFVDALNYVNLDWATLPSAMAAELGENRELLQAVAHELQHLYYIGGTVPQATGDAVSSKIRLYQIGKPTGADLVPQIRLQLVDGPEV